MDKNIFILKLLLLRIFEFENFLDNDFQMIEEFSVSPTSKPVGY